MAQVHAADLPDRVEARLPCEDYSTVAASTVRALGARVRDRRAGAAAGVEDLPDQLTRALIDDWLAVAGSVAVLVEQSTALGRDLRDGAGLRVLCHGDAHTANVVVGEDGQVWLTDWDGVAFAPPERDLMFVIGGVLADAPVTREQRSWFFDGYGRIDVDPRRLAYYLCTRALEDIAGFAVRVLDEHGRPPHERAEALAVFRAPEPKLAV